MSTPENATRMRVRPGADPYPLVQSLMAQMDALIATALQLNACFAPAPTVAPPAPLPPAPRKVFGRVYPALVNDVVVNVAGDAHNSDAGHPGVAPGGTTPPPDPAA